MEPVILFFLPALCFFFWVSRVAWEWEGIGGNGGEWGGMGRKERVGLLVGGMAYDVWYGVSLFFFLHL